MTESRVLAEIEACCSHHGLSVLPRNPRLLRFSVWDMPDTDVHRGVLWRTNTGAAKFGRRFVRFGLPGMPDFIGWRFDSGQMLAIEAKAPEGRLTADQVAFRILGSKTKILCATVHSYAECDQILTEWGLKREKETLQKAKSAD